MIDRRELNKLVRTLPRDQLSGRVEWYRGALERRRRRGEDTRQATALLDHVDELLEHLDQAEIVLAQGVDMYWGPTAQVRLGRACDAAEAAGLEVARFREPVRRLEKALAEHAIHGLLCELDYGERPPEDSERLSEIESQLDGYADEGIDVAKAQAAVERARYIERCWRRGVAPDSAEADALFDDGPDEYDGPGHGANVTGRAVIDDGHDAEFDDHAEREDDILDAFAAYALSGAYDDADDDNDDAHAESDDDHAHAGSDNDHAKLVVPDNSGSEVTHVGPLKSSSLVPNILSTDASPHARPATSSYSSSGRPVIEGFLQRMGIRHGVGVGANTLHALIRGLLALERAACVSIAGEQLVLVEYLHHHGMLRAKPCERSARAALRKLVKHSPFGEHISRTRWRYRLDQLWEPTSEFLAALAAYGR